MYDKIIGSKLKIQIVKNKTARSSSDSVSIEHYYDTGFNTTADLLSLACNADIIIKNGSWYSYDSFKLQGSLSVVNYINEDPALLEIIYDKVYDYYFN